MIRAAALLLLCTTTARAGAYCADLTALTDHTTTEIALLDGTPGTCTTSLDLTGARAINCRWPFDYRADAAMDAFIALLNATEHCLNADGVTDQDVNHPDSYDLRTFDTETAQVSVSIKDKGALQQTYVFLRVAPAR
ncbi:hypothetical protein [uncultured Tateyamaria sp.]|uniref:hypothetical protein n=1 Tax=uncultured Tateyamaria sp. TaxID=455651 RepID=UPI00260BF29C|nr:hypothetical protein [uncultured Tateyamaria sp.]